MKESIYYLNNQFLPASQAMLHVSDLTIMRGYGIFDFLITYNHKPFLLKDHLLRLQNSANQIGLDLPKPLKEIEKLVLAALEKNRSRREKAIRILVTGGESLPPDFSKAREKPSLIITVDPVHRYHRFLYSRGCKVITADHCQPIPGAKTLNYTLAIKAQREARKAGAIEAIYICEGHIMEGTTSNFFAVIEGKIVTSNQGILLGITRKVVLELAKKIVPIEERPIHKDEVESFAEAFITASNKEVMPVAQIDELRVGGGSGEVKPGPITRKVMRAFREYTRKI